MTSGMFALPTCMQTQIEKEKVEAGRIVGKERSMRVEIDLRELEHLWM